MSFDHQLLLLLFQCHVSLPIIVISHADTTTLALRARSPFGQVAMFFFHIFHLPVITQT